LVKEITKLANEDSDLFRLQVDETDIYNFKAWIKGPDGTPFAGGFFEVALEFTQGWPAKAPLASFVTKVFHANVSCTGAICVSSLQKDWQTSWGITDVLNVICSLLIHPNPDSALNEEASELMHERYDDYYRIATLWTKVHASFIPPCF
ncbi:UBC-like protein, partial [Tilletiaria anomala UBC 951]